MPATSFAVDRARPVRTAPFRLALLALLAACGDVSSTATPARVPTPRVEGPITAGRPAFVAGTAIDLAKVGYEQAEWFLSGTARSFRAAEALGSDGRWTIQTDAAIN
ncbi:MAG: alpha/beta hydrolase domain-containing protein, partial [Alphaproteobacteria bacterium]